MSQPLDYLTDDKKQLLNCEWLTNTKNSLTEALVRVFKKGEYRRSYTELESFYKQISEHLREESKFTTLEIYEKIFKNKDLLDFFKKNDVILVKDKNKDIRKLNFYFSHKPDIRFYFFPYIIRNLNINSNLIAYLSSISVSLPYNFS